MRTLVVLLLAACAPGTLQTIEELPPAERRAVLETWTEGALCRAYADPFLRPNMARSIEVVFQARGISHCGPIKTGTRRPV